jgi:hypothetical protein
MNIWHISLALVGLGIFGLLTAFTLPAGGARVRLTHVLYGVACLIVAAVVVGLWSNDVRKHKAEEKIAEIFEQHYSPDMMAQVALTFLEEYKDLYPEAYARGKKICESVRCLEIPPATASEAEVLKRMRDISHAALGLQGTLQALLPAGVLGAETHDHGH